MGQGWWFGGVFAFTSQSFSVVPSVFFFFPGLGPGLGPGASIVFGPPPPLKVWVFFFFFFVQWLSLQGGVSSGLVLVPLDYE